MLTELSEIFKRGWLQFVPLSATSSRKVFVFIEKSKSGINATGSPLRDKACMLTAASDPQCPNNGEDGYWSGLQTRCN